MKGRNPWDYDGTNGQQIFDRIMNINWVWSDVTIDRDAGTFEGTAFENELKGTIGFEGDSIVLQWTEGANGSGTAYTEDFDETTEFTYSLVDLDGEEVVEIHYLKDDSVFTNADVRP